MGNVDIDNVDLATKCSRALTRDSILYGHFVAPEIGRRPLAALRIAQNSTHRIAA